MRMGLLNLLSRSKGFNFQFSTTFGGKSKIHKRGVLIVVEPARLRHAGRFEFEVEVKIIRISA